jgi:hypothetical protein
MVDRTVLAKLSKAVAAEMASGARGAMTDATLRLLEAEPGGVLDLIDMLVAEAKNKRVNDALIAAYLHLIERTLDELRMDSEKGRASAGAAIESVRAYILDLGEASDLDPAVLLLMLRTLAEARLDPGEGLRQLMLQRMERQAEDAAAGPRTADPERAMIELAKDMEGDPFAFHAHMMEFANALPELNRAEFAAMMIRSVEPTAREAAIGFVLDASQAVRNAVAAAIEEAVPRGLVSGSAMRRLSVLRGWIPESSRVSVDRAIEACRSGAFLSASLSPSDIRELLVTGIDGGGAQNLFLVLREGRRDGFGAVLVKHGFGLRDAWVRHGLTLKERAEFLGEIKGELDTYPVSPDFAGIVAAHHLATNLARAEPPPFAAIEAVEMMGLAALRPEPWTFDRIMTRLQRERGAAADAMGPQEKPRCKTPRRYAFLESWFEDDDEVEALLTRGRPSRSKQMARVLDELLPSRRERWATLLAWTAFTLQQTAQHQIWQEFFTTAASVADGAKLGDLPLMVLVADQTVGVHRVRIEDASEPS